MIDGSASRGGTDTVPDREYELRTDGPIGGIAASFAAVLVLAAALAIPPFSEDVLLLWVLGTLLVVLLNSSVGSLAVGAYIEIRHRDWSRFRGIDHGVLAATLVPLAAADIALAVWLFLQHPASNWTSWGYLVVAATCAGAGGALSWFKLWPRSNDRPQKLRPDGRWPLLGVLSGFLGMGAGVVVAVLAVLVSAWASNNGAPSAHRVLHIGGFTGAYVALGDSYAAGEGLGPFEDGTTITGCHRSHQAYPELLRTALGRVPFSFRACSGAIISDILHPRPPRRGLLDPQVPPGRAYPDVRLVTVTVGGNDLLFSTIVGQCYEVADCLTEHFPPPGVPEVERVPPGPLYASWALATILAAGNQDAVLFHALRQRYPRARIIVVGYPLLFPDSRAGWVPNFCTSFLRRVSLSERIGLRTLETDLNNRTYEEAVAAGLEFVSPNAIWRFHEPCGANGQFTNSIKPYLEFPNPIDGGSFHPNRAGQQALAALLSCYLTDYRTPLNPFLSRSSGPLQVPATELVGPAQLGLAMPPGSRSNLPGCG